MDRLTQDLKVAVRSLVRQRTFTIVAVITLALGVGATTAIFSVVHGILLKPLPYDGSDRLVAFGQTAREAPAEPADGSSSHVNFLDWQRRARTMTAMALYAAGRAVLSHEGEADVVRIGSVTPEFFEVFRARPVIGRSFTAEENLPAGPRALVISHAFWQERFGGRPDVLSQSVELSGGAWPIVGVAPRGFDFPAGARLWTPVRNDDEQCGRGCVYLNGIGRLADHASVGVAQQELTAIADSLEREFPAANTDVTIRVQSLHERTVGSVQRALMVVFGAVAMVLLIACANVANLVLVRGAARQTEIAVRTALGAGRRGVVSYLLTEHLLLAACGGVLGVVLALWGIDALKHLAPASLPRLDEVSFDVTTFACALTLVVVTTVVFGLGPALQLSRTPLSQSLGHRGAVSGDGTTWTRSALLVAEVALSLVLMLGAGLLLRSLHALEDTDLGFASDHLTVFMVSLPTARYPQAQVIATHDQLDEQLRAMPAVTEVARISGLPLGPSESVLSFTRPDRPPSAPGREPVALFRVVDAEYFEVMQIALRSGRGFSPTDRAGTPIVAIISQRMAEVFWPGEDPVGRPIAISGQAPGTVIGVVDNVRSQGMARPADPEMYMAHAQTGLRSITYVVKSALDTPQVLASARQVVRRLDARLPLVFSGSMRALVDEQLARPRFYVVLLGGFALLALSLAAVGIYGVVAYVVTRRTREIGLRMALGARQRDVVALVLWQGLRPAAVGVTLGLGVAVAAGQVMQGLLYEVQPHDPMTWVLVPAVVCLIVVAACAIPARRASTLPPVDALRRE
jgi:putative ABC transport system permease protein